MPWEFTGSSSIRFYRRRDPFKSPLWKLLDKYFDIFKAVYSERYESKYGFFRSCISHAVIKYLKCGDLREGIFFTEGSKVNKVNKKFFVPFVNLCSNLKLACSRWAALIKRVYEINPLICHHCGELIKDTSLKRY